MNCTYKQYVADLKSQLCCNDPLPDCISYDYTDDQIDDNSKYFKNCHKRGLSAYKALLFFSDYMEGDYEL